MLCSLGGYRFTTTDNPFEKIDKKISYSFQGYDRYQGVEQLQFKGRKANEISIDVTVTVSRNKDADIVRDIERLGKDGKPLPLVVSGGDGGSFAGQWVITEISSSRTHYVKGVAFEQTATIKLKEFSDGKL